MQKRDLIQANASLENLRQNLDMKDIAKEILLEENYNKFIRSYKFQFVRISGYLWQNCGPGMPGPYRVTMRKPDMALRLAGRLYAAPTNRRKVYDKECRGRRPRRPAKGAGFFPANEPLKGCGGKSRLPLQPRINPHIPAHTLPQRRDHPCLVLKRFCCCWPSSAASTGAFTASGGSTPWAGCWAAV